VGEPAVLDVGGVEALVATLWEQGYTVVGPRLQDGAIVYDELRAAADLPVGWTDRQGPGRYRVEARPDGALFGYVVGPSSWKRFLHPPVAVVWKGRRVEGRVEHVPPDPAPRYALVGVRPCELAALDVLDRVLLRGEQPERVYAERRDGALVVAVNCTEPGGTCFCTSMGTGPRAGGGADLVLTEVIGAAGHHFLVEAGTERGADLLAALPSRSATPGEIDEAAGLLVEAASRMGRTLDTDGLPALLHRNLDHDRWEEVAARCLACANCTMVCPTCFCATIEDGLSLAGTEAVRVRKLDSCFSLDFSYIHGGSLRTSGAARYRQWLTHKLASWVDQFGTFGCVGCGRCITWCPVGIDLTEEAAAIRASEEGQHARA
jgi:ferredoxin